MRVLKPAFAVALVAVSVGCSWVIASNVAANCEALLVCCSFGFGKDDGINFCHR